MLRSGHRLQELQQKLLAHEVFKTFTAKQVDYVDLMRQVNDVIRKHLAPTERKITADSAIAPAATR
jgi:cell fate (sporulation/competence/biofilm development) regulator YlbF (YheA/YmcA/DUF963 family)